MYISLPCKLIIMKSIQLLLISLIFSSSVIAGPGKGASEIYELIESKCNSTFSFSVNQDLKDLFDMDIDMDGKEKWVKGDFSRGKFLMVDKEEADFKEVLKEFKKRNYYLTEMDDIDDQDSEDEFQERLFMYTDQKGDKLKEVHFVLEGENKMILLSIYGDLRIEK